VVVEYPGPISSRDRAGIGEMRIAHKYCTRHVTAENGPRVVKAIVASGINTNQ
jgi:hypothetical protein